MIAVSCIHVPGVVSANSGRRMNGGQRITRNAFLSRRAFAMQLNAYGCCVDRTNTMRIWRGITLVEQDP
jgi:hypothetical protein